MASLQRILLLASEVQIAPEGEHLQLGMWRNVISSWGALVQAIVAISMWAFAYDFITLVGTYILGQSQSSMFACVPCFLR